MTLVIYFVNEYSISDETTDAYTKQSDGSFYQDFNDALDKLFYDNSFIGKIDDIEKNRADILQLMKQLSNPPESYREDYSRLRELFAAYQELSNMVINPRGSLQTFTDNFNKVDEELGHLFMPLSIYVYE